MLRVRKDVIWLGLGCVVAACWFYGAATPASPPSGSFEVALLTQGDTVIDPATGMMLDHETDRAKAHHGITLTVSTSRPGLKATFIVPPWKGEAGTQLESEMRASPIADLYQAWTFVNEPNRPLIALKNPLGRYRLTAPVEVEVVLGEKQNYLPAPDLAPVRGDDAGGYMVAWKPVPGAVAYSVSTYGSSDTKWANSEQDWRAVGVQAALEKGILLQETTYVVPGGRYAEPFRIAVEAISPDVRVTGKVRGLGYAHSQKTVEVKPIHGVGPRNPKWVERDPDARSRPTDPYRAAIFDGDLKRVAQVLIEQPDLANQPSSAVTPLMLAIMRKNMAMVQLLLAHGAEVNLADGAGQTPLDFACAFSHDAEMVDLLLSKGAKIEIGNQSETPLHKAVRTGELDIVGVLLKRGANPNSKDSNGATPLDYSGSYKTERSTQIAALLKSREGRFSPPPPDRFSRRHYRAYPAPSADAIFQALDDAETLELYSIKTVQEDHWVSLGHAPIVGSERASLVKALKAGILDNDGMVTEHFKPRHAMVVRTGKGAYAMVIGFDSLQVYAYQFDPEHAYDPEGVYGQNLEMLTRDEPAASFDAVLKAHQVPLR